MSTLQTAERPGTSNLPTAIRDITIAWPSTVAPRHPLGPTGRQAPTRAPCRHEPRCPAADAVDHAAARVVVTYPEQGWSLLCNGVISFADTGELLPDGGVVEPHRAAPRRRGLAVRSE